jgi:hypothetical protein
LECEIAAISFAFSGEETLLQNFCVVLKCVVAAKKIAVQ